MQNDQMADILNRVANQELSVDAATAQLNQAQGFINLDYAKIDTAREARTGYPEIIYGEGKTAAQIIGIVKTMLTTKANVLVTRVSPEKADVVQQSFPELTYNSHAELMLWERQSVTPTKNHIAVVTAGTSDQKVAEEAAITAEIFGNAVDRVYDVGVAGIHRLFARLDIIRQAQVVIVVAGMEGALASVVGGLVDKPVIAVPTSVGYGTSFGGLSALLTMLNGCASGVTVVNIDNGFGAGYSASQINQLTEK